MFDRATRSFAGVIAVRLLTEIPVNDPQRLPHVMCCTSQSRVVPLGILTALAAGAPSPSSFEISDSRW